MNVLCGVYKLLSSLNSTAAGESWLPFCRLAFLPDGISGATELLAKLYHMKLLLPLLDGIDSIEDVVNT